MNGIKYKEMRLLLGHCVNASCVFCDVKLRFETVDKASCVFLSASGLEQSAVLVEESKDLFKQAPVSQQSLIMHLILAGV